VATYENCPLSYRLSNVLGFQPQLVAELGYGKAIHHILRRLADHVRIEERLPSAAEIESMLNSEFYLPFAHAAAFAKLREATQSLVHFMHTWRSTATICFASGRQSARSSCTWTRLF